MVWSANSHPRVGSDLLQGRKSMAELVISAVLMISSF
jgi:hypothetical protein